VIPTMEKEKKKTKSNKTAGILTIVMALFLVELFFCTWCRVQSRYYRYEINKKKAEQEELIRVQRSFRVEIERLKAPDRLGKIAREKLGLRPPNSGQVIVLP
jgi:cell division protein FtsL